ncbi:amino acid transporter AVT1C-like [Tasmannia lanceolata]|uniref:amino acid transporter AVT1C-like n=1 Tax=Tasmannia lanceolata TaxID=3420 RepID=UPI004062BFEF
MKMKSSLTSPNVGFQGRWSLRGLSRLFWPSSHKTKTEPTPEMDSALCKLLIPTDLEGDNPTLHRSAEDIQSKNFSQNLSHRDKVQSHQSSFPQAVVNGINVLCGVGLLTTPYAIKEGGWLGLLLLFSLGIISCYTGILLKQCLESTPEIQTYPDIGQAAFGIIGRLSVAIVLYVELYACCVEYITLMSDNMSSLFPNAHMNLVGLYLNPHQLFSIMTTIVVLPTVWPRNLSFLSYLSAGGVIASLLVAVCLLWVGVVDRVGFHQSGTALDLANVPVAIGLYGFCYSGHAVFPNIYSSMKKPSQFPAVLIVSFTICWVLYSGVGVAGYLMFGESIQSQFSLNLPQQLLASKTAVWTTVVNPLTKYALTINPVALSLEELLPSSQAKSYYISILIRTLLVLSTLVVALTFPFFGFVMALMGSLLTMLIALILPSACYLSIMRGRLSWFQVSVCILIILLGAMFAVIGSYSAIKRIAENM